MTLLLFCPDLVHIWLLSPLIARNVIKTIKNSISKEWLEKAIPQTTQHSLKILSYSAQFEDLPQKWTR